MVTQSCAAEREEGEKKFHITYVFNDMYYSFGGGAWPDVQVGAGNLGAAFSIYAGVLGLNRRHVRKRKGRATTKVHFRFKEGNDCAVDLTEDSRRLPRYHSRSRFRPERLQRSWGRVAPYEVSVYVNYLPPAEVCQSLSWSGMQMWAFDPNSKKVTLEKRLMEGKSVAEVVSSAIPYVDQLLEESPVAFMKLRRL
jgi:hypothetical protein